MIASPESASLAVMLHTGLRHRLQCSCSISQGLQWAVGVCREALDADLAEGHIVDQSPWQPDSGPSTAPQAAQIPGAAMLIAPVHIGDYPPDAYIILVRRWGAKPFTEHEQAALFEAASIIGQAIDERLSAIIA